MRKVTLLSLALIVVLTSCGPVTAVPPTLTPTVLAGVTSTSTPELSADIYNYQLRTWDEEGFRRQIPLGKEFLLRFPDSKYRYEVLRDVLGNLLKTNYVSDFRLQGDLMSEMIAAMLESGIPPEDLQSEIEKSDLHVYESFSMKNLMGNGEDDLVLRINACLLDCMMGIWVVFRNGENYRVEKIRDWDYSQWPQIVYKILDVGDTNGNGLSELMVGKNEYYSGTPPYSSETWDFIEWSRQDARFQVQKFPIFSQLCYFVPELDRQRFGDGSCKADWEFSRIGSQSKLITRSYWLTHEGCPFLAVQRVSIWDGMRYIPGKPEVVPPDGNLSPECKIAWASKAISIDRPVSEQEDGFLEPGWENSQAISILEQSLANWPAKADEWWGPASRDYFSLQLGIWKELRGEKDLATSLLEQVATNPNNTEFDFASRLASLYLQKRTVNGFLDACQSLFDVSEEEFDKVFTERFLYSSRAGNSLMIEAWGFAREDVMCRADDVIVAEAKNHRMVSVEVLDEWLKTLPYPVYQSTPIDLNGDGLEDRLVFLETRDNGGLDIWAFFMTMDGYTAKYFYSSSSKADHSDITIIPLEINSEVKGFLLSSDDTIFINVLKPDFQFDTNAYYFYFTVRSYTVISQTQPVQVMLDITDRDERKTLILSWDESRQSFDWQSAIDLTMSQIEKLLYVDRDYPSVINRVDTLLANSNFESSVATLCGISVADDFCVDFPEEDAAYFLYMRALSFEQMGLVNDARDAYYHLWQKYPQNLFGIIASKKLEPVQP